MPLITSAGRSYGGPAVHTLLVLAITVLVVATPSAVMPWSLGVFGTLRPGGLAMPAVLTVVPRLQAPPAETTP